MFEKIKDNAIHILSLLIAVLSFIWNFASTSQSQKNDIENLHERVDKTKRKVEKHEDEICNLRIFTARLEERIVCFNSTKTQPF